MWPALSASFLIFIAPFVFRSCVHFYLISFYSSSFHPSILIILPPSIPSILFPSSFYTSSFPIFASFFVILPWSLSFVNSFVVFASSFVRPSCLLFCSFSYPSVVHAFVPPFLRPLNTGIWFIQSLFHFLEPPPDLLGLFKDHEDWHLQRFFIR